MDINQKNKKSAGEVLLFLLAFTLIISVMNSTMFNVVLPVISDEFQLSTSQVSWIITSYMIVYAIGTVTYGKLTDKYNLKALMTFGLLVFSLGSILGLFANNYLLIIVGRIVQAIGSSVIPAVGVIIPVRYFPPEKRGRAIGTSAIGLALGTAIGPIVAGFVTSAWSWQVLFVIPIISLFTLPFYRKYLDDKIDKKEDTERIDFIGGIFLGGSVAIILLALTKGILWYVLAGAVLLILFVIRIRYATDPFIKPSIFKNKQYVFGLVLTFVMSAITYSIPFITPQMLSQTNHLSSASIGLIMLPSALITAFLGLKGGKLADEKGNPFLVYTAATLLIICFLCLSSVVSKSPFFIAFFLIFGILGQSFMQIALSNTVSQTLTKEQTGIGLGLFSMLIFISSASSTATLGKVLDLRTSSFHLNPFLYNSTAFIYSNIFIILAILVVLMTILYYMQIGRGTKKTVKGTKRERLTPQQK
ncbi:MFS transporter [Priestia megaterium]|uniref:MFS transporter n=1 Tax=Priestia megaterium TaxID=1404 RepID=A0A6M6E3C5_PRIMG|nr:MFS transporter [Priestia megaterium]QJX81422.1 MFS transporter [Priestia megaterium]